jgi:hypothetical protein
MLPPPQIHLNPNKRTTMNENSSKSILSIFDSDLTHETHTFLRQIILYSMVARDPTTVLNRFSVIQIKHCKKSSAGPQHELLLLTVIDTETPKSEPILILLERNASARAPSSYFLNHPNSATVLKNIMKTLKTKLNSASSSIGSPSSLRVSDPSCSQPPIPLSTFQYHRIDDSGSESHPSESPHLSLIDAATLKASKAFQSSASSSSQVFKADDRFQVLGSESKKDYLHCIHITKIVPKSLSLFEMAVLADAVHNHDPLYSPLKSQCYWFASMVCNVITQVYSCNEVTHHNEDLIDDICVPPNDYKPDWAGRWMGILVSDIEGTVSSVIAENFKVHLQAKQKEVRFIPQPQYLLKPRYRCKQCGKNFIGQKMS